MNKELYTQTLFSLSIDALKAMVIDIRAEVSAGLMNQKEAHDRLNCVSAVLMTKQLEEMGVDNHGVV
jgi:hypothetical protein